MSRLAAFFKDGGTRLGVFYPSHYLLAVFPNLEASDVAKRDLVKAGVTDAEVISASGEEVVEFAANQVLDDGITGFFMSKLSRAIGTETAYADNDLAAAKSGAAFIAVHCPTDELKTKAWNSLEPQHPISARYYSFGGIEHLAGDTQRG